MLFRSVAVTLMVVPAVLVAAIQELAHRGKVITVARAAVAAARAKLVALMARRRVETG